MAPFYPHGHNCPRCGSDRTCPDCRAAEQAAAPAAPPEVIHEPPPFRALEGPAFPALDEPAAAPPAGPSLLDRFAAMPKRRRNLALAVVVLAMLAAGAFWPSTAESFAPRPTQPEPAPVYLISGGDPVNVPPVELALPTRLHAALVTGKPIPLNTPITRENLNEFFQTVAVKAPPAGVLDTAESLVGRCAQRDIPANQFVTADLFGEAAIAPPPRAYVAPEPERLSVNVHTASGVTELVYEKTGGGYRLLERKTPPAAPAP